MARRAYRSVTAALRLCNGRAGRPRQIDTKLASASFAAAYFDATPVRLDDRFHQAQAKAEAGRIAGFIAAIKSLPDARLIVLGNAGTGVGENDFHLVVWHSPELDRDAT